MNKILVLLLVIVLLTVSVSAQDAEWELTETQTISLSTLGDDNYRFNIAYPAGWFADQGFLTVQERRRSVWAITEFEEDLQQVFDATYQIQGYVILYDEPGYTLLTNFYDLPRTDTTLEDLAAAIVRLYEYQEPVETSETTVLWQEPALSLRTVDKTGNAVMAVVGFSREYKPFAFSLVAPSEEALDAFLPTWETMLAGIEVEAGYINLGDHSLYLDCLGNGSPTVILEPNVDINSWSSRTMRSIAEFTRVCTHKLFARGDTLRTIQDNASILHDGLEATGVAGPYVLVGPYVGGYLVLVYADAYPDEVAGMVLVDSFHPDHFSLLMELDMIDWEETLSYWSGWGLDYEPSIAQVAAVDSLGDLPLVVLVAGQEGGDGEEFHRIWTEEQQPELAALSTSSTLIVMEGAYHTQNTPNRSEVIDAILAMVEQIRAEETE